MVGLLSDRCKGQNFNERLTRRDVIIIKGETNFDDRVSPKMLLNSQCTLLQLAGEFQLVT